MLQTEAMCADIHAQVMMILERAAQDLNVEAAGVYAFEHDTEERIVWAHSGTRIDVAAVRSHILQAQSKLVKNIPVVGNVEVNTAVAPGAGAGLKSYILVTINARKSAWGALACLDTQQIRHWSMSELTDVLALSREIEPLIERELDIRQMQQYNMEYRLLADHISDIIVRIGEDTKIVSCGGYLFARGVFKAEDYLGKNYTDMICTEKGEPLPELMSPQEFMSRRRSLDVCLRMHDGGVNWMRLKSYPVYEQGKAAGMLCVMTDIHQMVVTQNALKESQTSYKALIEEMQLAEDRLRESEAKYRTLAESLNACLIMIRQDFVPEYVSPAISRFLGYSPEEMLALITGGQAYAKILSPASFQDFESYLEVNFSEIKTTWEGPGLEFEFIRKDGSIAGGLVTFNPVKDAAGGAQRAIVLIQDISMGIMKKKMMREIENRYPYARGAFGNAFVMDFEGRIIESNENTCSILGLRNLQAKRIDLRQILAPRQYEQLQIQVSLIRKTLDISEILELQISRGRKIALMMCLNYQGAFPDTVLCAALDITPRITSYPVLDMDAFQEAAECSYQLIWITDEKLCTTYMSPSIKHLLGYDLEDALVMEFGKTYSEATLRAVTQAIDKGLAAMKDGRPYDVMIPVEQYHKDGTLKKGALRLRLRYKNNTPTGFMGIIQFAIDT